MVFTFEIAEVSKKDTSVDVLIELLHVMMSLNKFYLSGLRCSSRLCRALLYCVVLTTNGKRI